LSITSIDYLADHPGAILTLARWHHAQWKHLNPNDTVAQRIARFQAHLGKRQIPTTFVALAVAETQSDGRVPASVLGSASLIAHDMDTRPDLSPWLASVFVASQHRGQGIGTALVRRVIQEAETLGVENLYLFTTPDKRGFYTRLDWELIERTRYRGYSQIVMALRLGPSDV
jgi:GNAT superfamily N-acetyltransferase